MKRLRRVLGMLGLVGAAIALIRMVGRSSSRKQPVERRAEPDPEALEALGNGEAGRVGLNLELLKRMKEATHEPLIEYLTYIQVQRGENQSLVFVRQRDLDALATLAGESRESFVDQFQQLGVLLSMN